MLRNICDGNLQKNSKIGWKEFLNPLASKPLVVLVLLVMMVMMVLTINVIEV